MKSKSHILISGYYGFDNSGDDAILKAMVKDMLSEDEKLNIKVLSNNPKKTNEIYNVESVDRFNYKEVIKAMRDTDLFISGGGSLLQDVTSTRSIFYYLSLMGLALIFKKPIMVYANGIGPINKKINRTLTRWILNHVDTITLRDEGSKDYLSSLGVKNTNVFVTADPVFTLEEAQPSRVEEILRDENIPTHKKIVGIAIRHWRDDLRLVEAISKFIELITKEFDVNVVLVPMHYPEDLKISNMVKSKIDSQSCYALQRKYSVEEIMGVIKSMDLIIGMRLHTLIYAATQEVPMIGIVYDPKIKGFLQEMNIDHWVDVDEIDEIKLYKIFQEAWNTRYKLKESIIQNHDRFKEQAKYNVHKVFEMLGR